MKKSSAVSPPSLVETSGITLGMVGTTLGMVGTETGTFTTATGEELAPSDDASNESEVVEVGVDIAGGGGGASKLLQTGGLLGRGWHLQQHVA